MNPEKNRGRNTASPAELAAINPYNEHPSELQEAAVQYFIDQAAEREAKLQAAEAQLAREIAAEQEYVRACEGVLPYAENLLGEIGAPVPDGWQLIERHTDDHSLFVEPHEEGETGLIGDHFRYWRSETNPNAGMSVWLRTKDGLMSPFPTVTVRSHAPDGGVSFKFEVDTEAEAEHHVDEIVAHSVSSSEMEFERRESGKGENGRLIAGISVRYDEGLPWYVTINDSIPWTHGSLFKERDGEVTIDEEFCRKAQAYLKDNFGYEYDFVAAIRGGEVINPVETLIATRNALEAGDSSGPVIIKDEKSDNVVQNVAEVVPMSV